MMTKKKPKFGTRSMVEIEPLPIIWLKFFKLWPNLFWATVKLFLGGNQFFWVIGSMVESEPLSKTFKATIKNKIGCLVWWLKN